MDQLKRMFDTHPEPASDAGETVIEAVYDAAQCALVCTTCADACLAESGDMADCIRRNLDCTDVCFTVAKMLSRPGRQDPETLTRTLAACARACRACAEECRRHADAMEHCRICADTCEACAEACDRMAAAVV